MTDRRDYKLPEPLAADFEAYKRDEQTFPAFIREDVIPALEAAENDETDALAARLDDIEAAAREATEAAQAAERAVDDLAGGSQR